MTRSRVSWVVASTNGTNITNVNPIQILPNVTSLGWGRIRLENIAIIDLNLTVSAWEVSPEYELDAGGEDKGDGAAAGEHKDEGEEGEQAHQEQVTGHSRGLTQYYTGGKTLILMFVLTTYFITVSHHVNLDWNSEIVIKAECIIMICRFNTLIHTYHCFSKCSYISVSSVVLLYDHYQEPGASVVWHVSRHCVVQDTDMMPTRNWEKLCTCEIILISDNNIYTFRTSELCVAATCRMDFQWPVCPHCGVGSQACQRGILVLSLSLSLAPDPWHYDTETWHFLTLTPMDEWSLVLVFSLYCDFQLLHYFVLTKTTQKMTTHDLD